MGKDIGPDRMIGGWGMRDDPELLFGMVDQGDDFALSGSNGPSAAQEVEGMVGV